MLVMKDNDIKIILADLYSDCFEVSDTVDVNSLPQAGGDRRYFRISGVAGSCVGTYDPDVAESRCFRSLAKALRGEGASVPRVLDSCADSRFYLQEDLGDRSLFSVLSDPDAVPLIRETLSRLVRMQKVPKDKWLGCCMTEPFSSRQVMWDLNYFKYEYLKPSCVVFDENKLEDDFVRIASDFCLIPDEFSGFMMRDCQSRNVMLTPDGPVFIDFQGGRLGPVLYDAVSFLWQSRAGFSPSFRERMILYYADTYCNGDDLKIKKMLADLPLIVLFRTLQVLGAYGFRGLVQHRAHFIISIPGALDNLKGLIDNGALDRYPELKKVSLELVEDPRFVKNPSSRNDNTLTVEIFSFSYKKGYPDDFSGNGGGFIFDCRAMHNPGRYPQYGNLTGRDASVKEFLEKRGEVRNFLAGAWSLIDPAVERYLRRGFSNLHIGFGCTGGQHRSVYCAEATAKHIAEIFPEANISLVHREHPC